MFGAGESLVEVHGVPGVGSLLGYGEGGGAGGAGKAGEPGEGGGVGGGARGAPEPGFLLLVGRLRIRKGVDVLLAAMPELRRRQPSARLLIAGDGEHRAALERHAAALALGESVTFLGRVGAPRVRELLRGAAALVVPSIYEGMPLVVLEAMEAAVPVVASRVAGIPEVVEDGRTGWLVPPEDPPRLAAALAAVLGDPAEARRRGAAGRQRLDRHFRPVHAVWSWRRAVLQAGSDEGASAVGRLEPR